MAARRLALLGSTGSIGQSTLSVCKNLGPEQVDVVALAAGSQWEALAAQAREFQPKVVAIANEAHGNQLREALAGTGIEVLCGEDACRQAVPASECDTVLASVTGAAGLSAVLEAARLGLRICLSNKESLVLAGPILTRLAREHGAELLPVDSEHSAIFQSLESGGAKAAKRLILTASGGPFREWSAERITSATRAEALEHPTWKMGPYITIDSATLMNKALEVIEARWLFDLPPEQIDVIVHPQSIIHSLVEFVDGSVMCQMGVPDMRVPIQYAITYPARKPLTTAAFDLATIAQLTFEEVDRARFPALDLAYEVLRRGGVSGAVFNAANEVARAAFLEQEGVSFPRIVETTVRVLELHASSGPGRDTDSPGLDEVLEADRWAREEAKRCLAQ